MPNLFSKSMDALAHEWPSLPLYAFPPIALLLQVLRWVREQRHKLILIAPLWRNQSWVSELFQLLKAARGRSPWDGTSSLKRTARYGLHGPSYGPFVIQLFKCMCVQQNSLLKNCNKHVFSLACLCIYSWVCFIINREHTFRIDGNIYF